MLPLQRVLEVALRVDVPTSDGISGLPGEAATEARCAVRLQSGAGTRWLAVEDVLAPVELVVRALPSALDAGPWRGAAIESSGRVVLVLDPDRLGT